LAPIFTACMHDHCNSRGRSVRPSVHPPRSVVLSGRMKIRSCGFQHQVGQVAQLSQRDRAAGWVDYGQKWKTIKLGDNILQTL